MSEAAFNLVGEILKARRRANYAVILGVGVFAVGFVLNKLKLPAGGTLQGLGLMLGLPSLLYGYFKMYTEQPEREILTTQVVFRPDEIVVGTERIDLGQIKVIEGNLEYKGQYRRKSIADGTGNVLVLVNHDLSETTLRFYLTNDEQLTALEELLRAARQRYGLTLTL